MQASEAQKPRPAVPEFLEEISIISGEFPMEQMREVWERGDEFEDVLVSYLEWLAGSEQPGLQVAEEDCLLLIACFLLADRGSPRLFDPLVAIAFNEGYSEAMLGDTNVEFLPAWLRVSGKGRGADLRKILEDPEASEWLRAAALSALGGMAWEGGIPKDDHLEHLRRLPDLLPREETYLWNEWLTQVVAFRMEDQLDRIAQIESEGFFGEVGDGVEWAREEMSSPLVNEFAERELFHVRPGGTAGLERFSNFAFFPGDDDYDEHDAEVPALEWIPGAGGYTTPAPVIQMIREAPKIGRNDPCPCGSGKKWKKCCGSASAGG
jgi:hypothetical protein